MRIILPFLVIGIAACGNFSKKDTTERSYKASNEEYLHERGIDSFVLFSIETLAKLDTCGGVYREKIGWFILSNESMFINMSEQAFIKLLGKPTLSSQIDYFTLNYGSDTLYDARKLVYVHSTAGLCNSLDDPNFVLNYYFQNDSLKLIDGSYY